MFKRFYHKYLTPRMLKRRIRFLYQRLTRSFDDSETWSLDYSLSKIILPRLKRFKELKNGTPYHVSEEEWQSNLDKMIAFFEFASSEERWNAAPDEYEKYNEGIDLFAKHFYDLWW